MSQGEGIGVAGCCGGLAPKFAKAQGLYASNAAGTLSPFLTNLTDPAGDPPYPQSAAPAVPRDSSDAVNLCEAMIYPAGGPAPIDAAHQGDSKQINDVGLGSPTVPGSHGCFGESELIYSFGSVGFGEFLSKILFAGNFNGTGLFAASYFGEDFVNPPPPSPFEIFPQGGDFFSNMTQAGRFRIAFDAPVTYIVAQCQLVGTDFQEDGNFDSGNNFLNFVYDGPQTIVIPATASIISSGSLPALTWLQVDCPPSVLPTVPQSLTDMVNYGFLRWVIINTTAAVWSARTGIALS